MPIDWNHDLVDQLDWHWREFVRPRLETLTDDELFWEPVPGCWSVRPRAEALPTAVGAGDLVIEYAYPEPDPPPVTTIAWRLGHLTVGVFGERAANHFGGPPVTYQTAVYPATAADALAQLDAAYADWTKGASGLGPERLARPVGEAEGPWAEHPYSDLILHINREAIHHGAEILLLRDLYRSRS